MYYVEPKQKKQSQRYLSKHKRLDFQKGCSFIEGIRLKNVFPDSPILILMLLFVHIQYINWGIHTFNPNFILIRLYFLGYVGKRLVPD